MTARADSIRNKCLELHQAYKEGLLGDQTMPEDTHPDFTTSEERLAFFTLPMALNYQRNSYKLWESATRTFCDPETKQVYSATNCSTLDESDLRKLLLKHGLALQPNKHIDTWRRIAETITLNWGSIEELMRAADHDFLKLQEIVQKTHKKGFPYLSGQKIFHYWCFILGEYAGIDLANKDSIQIAPDTHVVQCSVRLGVITAQQASLLSRDQISDIWRKLLIDLGISPIDMHSPLWFWSRNKFSYTLTGD